MEEKKGLVERMQLSVEDAYDRVLKSDAYESFCRVMACFPQFDIRNQILVWLRAPEAESIASEKDIQSIGGGRLKRGKQVLLLEPEVTMRMSEMEASEPGQAAFDYKYKAGIYYSVSGISAFSGENDSDHFIGRFRHYTQASVAEDDSCVRGRRNNSLYDARHNVLFLRPGLAEAVKRKELLHQMIEYLYARKISDNPDFFNKYARPDTQGKELADREWDKKYLIEYCAYLHFGIPYCKDSIRLVVHDLEGYDREQLRDFLFECSQEFGALIKAMRRSFFSFYEVFLARAFVFTENQEWIRMTLRTFLEQVRENRSRYESRYVTAFTQSMFRNILLLPAEGLNEMAESIKSGSLSTFPVIYTEK